MDQACKIIPKMSKTQFCDALITYETVRTQWLVYHNKVIKIFNKFYHIPRGRKIAKTFRNCENEMFRHLNSLKSHNTDPKNFSITLFS